MSAIIEFNQAQIDAVLNELTTLKTNLTTGIRPSLIEFMRQVEALAEQRTHKITELLSKAWTIYETQNTQGVTVTLANQMSYAEEEFERPGIKQEEGTPHDVRPELVDEVRFSIEDVVFKAATKDLR